MITKEKKREYSIKYYYDNIEKERERKYKWARDNKSKINNREQIKRNNSIKNRYWNYLLNNKTLGRYISEERLFTKDDIIEIEKNNIN